VLGEGGIIVESDGLAQRGFDPSEHREHDRNGLGGSLSGEPNRKRHARFALMENEHRPCALTNDEVTLPVAALGSGVDILGPFVDGDAIPDGILRRSRSARTAAFVTAREIAPQLLGLLGCPVDEGVDRLATHDPQTTFVSSLQPARNLLGGPPFCEAIDNEGSQGSIYFDQRFTPPAQLIGSGGVKRRVAPTRQPVAAEFARDRRFRTADRLAIAPIEWPKALARPICSLSSSDKCE
jgi:hypothetical protein